MGGIWLKRAELIGTLGEIVGYKSGLALTRDEFAEIVPVDYQKLWFGDDGIMLRIRSEEYEDLVSSFLQTVGAVPPRPTTVSFAELLLERKTEKLRTYMAVQGIWERLEIRAGKKSTPINTAAFLRDIEKRFGSYGAQVASTLSYEHDFGRQLNPWDTYRRYEWVNIAELSEIFRSESLETMYGSFIDQRFIDYIAANFDKVDEMNWRKFEGLAAEFFERAGYHVQLGPGRNDDNVDIRLWKEPPGVGDSPTILVQCKRQRKAVGKIVVKALWADVLHQNATSGLIVTTSALSPGAKKTMVARGYPIHQVDRDRLRKWLERLRTPWTGPYLAE